ncbi:MAG: nitrite/sulfite reductase [Planctomycetes bacterium]|nr:nitrite/sulfite reductase [Planctomycetota bacterium]
MIQRTYTTATRRIVKLLVLPPVALFAGCVTLAPSPPIAQVIPHTTTIHGQTRVDDYHWLRDRGRQDVIAYLEAENAYTEGMTWQTRGLRERLYREMKARIKVLIQKEGIDSFRLQVEEELKEEWAKDYGSREDLLFFDDELADVPTPPNGYRAGGQDDPDFHAWKSTNVASQTESGYNFVTIKVPQGDLRPGQFYALGEIARTRASSRIRTTAEQNLMLRWVPDAYLHDVYQGLKAIELAESGVNGITDITACPGTDSCKMGITSTMGLSHALALSLKSPNGHTSLLEDPLVQQMHIKMSGCPNGCGRHHMADIGFQGAAMKGPTGAQVPSYELFVGGSYENADVRYGIRPRGKIPAKRIPEATVRLLSYYRENRQEGEQFKDFAIRVGKEPFEKIISDLNDVPTLGRDNIDLYMDYERTVLYVMERGEGKCGV